MSARYAIGGMLAAILLALPAGAAAKGGLGQAEGQVNGVAAQQCAQERADLGKTAFRKKYGAKHTMRTCVKRHRAQVASVLPAANDACQQELAQAGPLDFLDIYGEDPTDTLDAALSAASPKPSTRSCIPGTTARTSAMSKASGARLR